MSSGHVIVWVVEKDGKTQGLTQWKQVFSLDLFYGDWVGVTSERLQCGRSQLTMTVDNHQVPQNALENIHAWGL